MEYRSYQELGIDVGNRHAVFMPWFQQLVLRWRKRFGVFSSLLVPFPRDSSTLDPMECMDTAEEQRVHSPPSSLVPRIHVILAHKLQHLNPLLPACLNEEESKTCEYTSVYTLVNVQFAGTYGQGFLSSETNASVLDLLLSFVKVEEPFNATAIQNMSLYLCDAYALLFLN